VAIDLTPRSPEKKSDAEVLQHLKASIKAAPSVDQSSGSSK
jgi:hypothetical protein